MENKCIYKYINGQKADYCLMSDCFCPNEIANKPSCYKDNKDKISVRCPNCNTEFVTGRDIETKNIPELPNDAEGTFYLTSKRQNNMKTNTNNKEFSMRDYNNTIDNHVKTKDKRLTMELENNGVNPNQYVSLTDLQTVLQQILSTTQQPSQLNNTSKSTINDMENKEQTRHFAPNSKFHNQTMIDGNIFNPYLHRRFLPVQYLALMNYKPTRVYDKSSFEAALRDNYCYQYTIEYTIKEIKKLAYLSWSDPISFNERNHFFNLKMTKQVISDYVNKCVEYIDNCEAIKIKSSHMKKISGRGFILAYAPDGKSESEELIELKSELAVFNRQVYKCNNYQKMYKLLESFDYIKLPFETKKSKEFIQAFKGSGAYYTLKHLIMFENCKFKDSLNQAHGLALLKDYVNDNTPAYVFHAMLKELIADNNLSMKFYKN